MNAETFAEFYRRCGHTVFRSASSWWYEAHRCYLMSVPYFREISPSPSEMEEIFRAYPSVIGARYFGPSFGPGKSSYLITCRDKQFDLQSLKAHTRPKVRTSLRNCEVRQLDRREAAGTYELMRDTCVRQGRRPEFTTRQWAQLCEAAASLPGFEAWGAFAKGELATYELVFQCDEYAVALYRYSRTALLRARPNDALVFTMIREMLARPGIEVMCSGPESLEDVSSLNHFKFDLGYSQQPIKQVSVISPYWRGAASPVVHRCVVAIAGRTRPGSSFRKAAGLSKLVQATLASRSADGG